MPFGLKNAPACFQEIMQGIFEGNESCTPYMDDLIIFSSTWEDHLRDVERVLQTLKEAGLTANPRKCVWGGRYVEFLGHKVGGGRMALPEHRAEAFRNYTRPVTKKGLRSFIGAVSFYRRYIRQLASETAKLTPLTSKLAPSKADASGLGIGGVLQVERDGRWEAAAFYSRQLRGAEQRYSATELEALAQTG